MLFIVILVSSRGPTILWWKRLWERFDCRILHWCFSVSLGWKKVRFLSWECSRRDWLWLYKHEFLGLGMGTRWSSLLVLSCEVFEKPRRLGLHRTTSSVLFHRGKTVAWLPLKLRYDLIYRAKISIATAIVTTVHRLHSLGCSKLKYESCWPL